VFYIVGVAHRVQCKREGTEESSEQEEFRTVLASFIEKNRPVLVAEELSKESLEDASEGQNAKYNSVAEMVAKSLNIEHRFCDPDSDAREKMGYKNGRQLAQEIATSEGKDPSDQEIKVQGYAIEVAKHWPCREQFWLGRLSNVRDNDVIFICGEFHIESFRELLERNEVYSIVAARHIGVSQEDDEFWNQVTAYLRAHSELR
jgi:hypothetical protein